MKKQNKKNNHAGRNIFGQKCITKEVILNKENALEQYLEVLNDIEQHRQLGINIEYDVKLPKDVFSQDEILVKHGEQKKQYTYGYVMRLLEMSGFLFMFMKDGQVYILRQADVKEGYSQLKELLENKVRKAA